LGKCRAALSIENTPKTNSPYIVSTSGQFKPSNFRNSGVIGRTDHNDRRRADKRTRKLLAIRSNPSDVGRLMRRFLVPILLLAVLLGAFAWWWFRPERVIARRVAGLFEAANVTADSGNLTRSTRGSALEPYLADTITFEGPDGPTDEVEGPQKREDIVTMYTALARFCRSATVQDLTVESVEITGDEALVRATVDAVIELQNNERPVDGIQHLDMTWRKQEGVWRMSRAEWKDTGR
jgi:hypothetical protein